MKEPAIQHAAQQTEFRNRPSKARYGAKMRTLPLVLTLELNDPGRERLGRRRKAETGTFELNGQAPLIFSVS